MSRAPKSAEKAISEPKSSIAPIWPYFIPFLHRPRQYDDGSRCGAVGGGPLLGRACVQPNQCVRAIVHSGALVRCVRVRGVFGRERPDGSGQGDTRRRPAKLSGARSKAEQTNRLRRERKHTPHGARRAELDRSDIGPPRPLRGVEAQALSSPPERAASCSAQGRCLAV